MSATKPILISAIERESIQPRAATSEETVARYAEQMTLNAEGQVVTPTGELWPFVVVFQDGQGRLWLADGAHRVEAARRVGATQIQARIKPGGQLDALRYALTANGRHGLPLTNADKRRIVELALTTTHAEATAGALAAELGFVSQPFVSKVRRDLELQGRVQAAAARRGADGKMYTAPPATAPAPAEVKTVLTPAPAEDDPQVDLEREAQRRSMEQIVGRVVTPERVAAAGVPVRQAVGEVIDPAHQSGDDLAKRIKQEQRDSWSTPPEFLERIARPLLGKIDLDPASNEAAQAVVNARRWFSAADDGLAQEWGGSVWLNPPYSFPLVERFADKALEEWEARRVAHMLILVNSSTSSAWWHKLARACSLLTFPDQRIQFWSPHALDGDANRNASTLFCFTRNKETAWMMTLRKEGFIVYRNTLA